MRTALRTSLALVAAIAAGAGIVAPTNAHAQQTHRLAPVGGRTTLVGGTGLVFGHDSASAFLNPATVVRIDKNRLSFSVDFYYLSYLSSGSWYQPGLIDQTRFGNIAVDGNNAVSAFDFDTLPGSLCFFFAVGSLPWIGKIDKKDLDERQARLGFCLASVQYNAFTFNAEDYEQQTPTGVTRQSQNFRQTFRRLSFGPTYSMYLSDRIVAGASLHASRSSHRSIIGATSTTYAGEAINSAFYNVTRGDSHELTATLGLTYRISRRQTVGISMQSPSLHVFGSGGINHQTDYRVPGQGATESTFSGAGSFVTRTPPRVAIGTGVEGAWGSAELNVAFHAPIGEAYSADIDGRTFDTADGKAPVDAKRSVHYSTRATGSVNFGVGGEYFTSSRISLLAGLSVDMSIVPKGALQSDPFAFYPSRTHRLAASFGIGSHGDNGDLLVGIEPSYGWGERLTPNMYQLPARLDVTEQKTYGLLFVLAGSTSFKSFKKAVENVKQVVDPTTMPPVKPAPAEPAETKPESKPESKPEPSKNKPDKPDKPEKPDAPKPKPAK